MDNYLLELYVGIIFKYVNLLCEQKKLTQFSLETTTKYKKASSNINNYQAIVTLWYDNYIIELEIRNGDDTLFYLHYDIKSIKQCFIYLNNFFNVYYNFINHKKTNILVCCTGGLSSNLFASQLQMLANEYEYLFSFFAKGINDIDTNIELYDIILLAPQVGYKLPAVINKTKKYQKVFCISTIDYAKQNYSQLFFWIVEIGFMQK